MVPPDPRSLPWQQAGHLTTMRSAVPAAVTQGMRGTESLGALEPRMPARQGCRLPVTTQYPCNAQGSSSQTRAQQQPGQGKSRQLLAVY